MFVAANLQLLALDMPTLGFVAVCIAAMLGLFLIFAWLQQPSVRALAWWGSAYLIGASSMASWSVPRPLFELPTAVPAALIFVACGMMWNGVRLFHARPLLPVAAFGGAIAWLILCQFPALSAGSNARIALGAVVVAGYTFFIAFELRRERRKSLYSRTAAIVVPCLHAAIFLTPLAMRAFLPHGLAAGWLTLFALETIIYTVGAAFIVLLMVKDHHVHIYRSAATTDHLTGLLNRRAFMENALSLCAREGQSGKPVTLMMFDLDHFKSINDRFGHAVGDDVLRVFAEVARSSMRGSDIVARFGGEEFAAIVPEPMELAERIAERLRAGFEAAGVTVGAHAVGATVSIGAATSHAPVTNIDALIARADAALYRAKHDGRNRLCAAAEEPASEQARLIAAARGAPKAGLGRFLQRKSGARPAQQAGAAATGKGATSPLLYSR
jgi:diguanylate cyclase (GGDEF)-like protein